MSIWSAVQPMPVQWIWALHLLISILGGIVLKCRQELIWHYHKWCAVWNQRQYTTVFQSINYHAIVRKRFIWASEVFAFCHSFVCLSLHISIQLLRYIDFAYYCEHLLIHSIYLLFRLSLFSWLTRVYFRCECLRCPICMLCIASHNIN